MILVGMNRVLGPHRESGLGLDLGLQGWDRSGFQCCLRVPGLLLERMCVYITYIYMYIHTVIYVYL